MTSIFVILLFVLTIGMCVGSFINVVVLRAFSNESIVFPGSKCPKCQKKLKWYHNVPVLSFLFLKGKCAYCKEKISVQYPIVELITGILFLLLFIKYGFDYIKLLFMWYFVSVFLVLAITDIKEKVIFDFHSYFLVVGGLIFNFFNIGNLYLGEFSFKIGTLVLTIQNSFIASIIGLLLGILIMESLAGLGYLMVKERAFGEGDSYIAAGLGAIFGWKYLLIALLCALILQTALTVPVFLAKLFKTKNFKTLIAIAIFTLLVIIPNVIQNFYSHEMLFYLTTLLLFITGVYICKRILCGMKDKSDMTYLPFGPAMVISATIILFMI